MPMKKPSLEADSEDKNQEVSAVSEIELLYLYFTSGKREGSSPGPLDRLLACSWRREGFGTCTGPLFGFGLSAVAFYLD
jgi:hypothetical protein